MDGYREQLSGVPVSGTALIAILTVALLLLHAGLRRQDAREPPYLSPYSLGVGHLVNLFRQGASYYITLDRTYSLRFYTLPMLKGRMYITSSPEWAHAIEKSHQTLVSNTLTVQALRSLFCLDDAMMEMLRYNLNGENGQREGVMIEVHEVISSALAPGPNLDALNDSFLRQISSAVNALTRPDGGASTVDLWQWVRYHFTQATAAAIWGPQSPLTLNPGLVSVFWEFERAYLPLILMPFPRLLLRRAYGARQRLFTMFEQYVANKGYEDPEASHLAKNRFKVNKGKFQISDKMLARGEVGMLFGAVVNTTPMAFWLLSRIFEDAQLLADIRAEVDACVSTSGTRSIISANKLCTRCPILSSAYREALRLAAPLNVNRLVAEDTCLANPVTGESYMLKKGGIVLIAGNVTHKQQSLYGADADCFNARRFMGLSPRGTAPGTGAAQESGGMIRDAQGRVRKSAFRSFGGGTTLCSGRHFSRTAILAFVGLLLAGFEIDGAGTGKYKAPSSVDLTMMTSTMIPGNDVEVVISRRLGREDTEWVVER